MFWIRGHEVEFFESKDFGQRTEFDTDQQHRTALRWAANPVRMKSLQRRKERTWTHLRMRSGREFQIMIDRVLKDPKAYRRVRREAGSWLEQWSHKAYRYGMAAAGIGDLPMMDSDLDWLAKSFYTTEWRFLKNFLDEIRQGIVSPARARMRARMYAQTLDSVFYVALVSSFPATKGTRIEWVLGPVEHCPDCLALGHKRYFTPRTLPTTPRAGSTRCLSNCRCWLTVVYKPVRIGLAPRTRRAAATAGFETDDPVIREYGLEQGSPLATLLQE